LCVDDLGLPTRYFWLGIVWIRYCDKGSSADKKIPGFVRFFGGLVRIFGWLIKILTTVFA
jgi:hypothetical protein